MIPSATGSTIVGIAALLTGCLALGMHVITPDVAKTVAGWAVPVICGGLAAITIRQRAAPHPPVTAADQTQPAGVPVHVIGDKP